MVQVRTVFTPLFGPLTPSVKPAAATAARWIVTRPALTSLRGQTIVSRVLNDSFTSDVTLVGHDEYLCQPLIPTIVLSLHTLLLMQCNVTLVSDDEN